MLLDLDNPDARSLEALWYELRRRHAEELGSSLLVDVARAITQAAHDGRLAQEDAAELRFELSERAPADVLRCWWHDLVPDRAALGFFVGVAA